MPLLVQAFFGHRIELSCSLDRLLGLRVGWELGFTGRLGRLSVANRLVCRSEDRNAFGLGLPNLWVDHCPVFGSKTPAECPWSLDCKVFPQRWWVFSPSLPGPASMRIILSLLVFCWNSSGSTPFGHSGRSLEVRKWNLSWVVSWSSIDQVFLATVYL